jgi:hypothetical protein
MKRGNARRGQAAVLLEAKGPHAAHFSSLAERLQTSYGTIMGMMTNLPFNIAK